MTHEITLAVMYLDRLLTIAEEQLSSNTQGRGDTAIGVDQRLVMEGCD